MPLLTTRQKYLAAVMVLAGIAFAYDRATSGKPPAEGDPAAATAADLLVAQPAAGVHATATGGATASRLGARLADAADAERLDPLNAADAFLVPDAWPILRRPVTQAPLISPPG